VQGVLQRGVRRGQPVVVLGHRELGQVRQVLQSLVDLRDVRRGRHLVELRVPGAVRSGTGLLVAHSATSPSATGDGTGVDWSGSGGPAVLVAAFLVPALRVAVVRVPGSAGAGVDFLVADVLVADFLAADFLAAAGVLVGLRLDVRGPVSAADPVARSAVD
jgi:hypothetical protein